MGAALQHLAVGGDAFAGTHKDAITGGKIIHIHILGLAVLREPSGMTGLQAHKRLNGGTGAALGAGLQPAANQDQGHDHRRRLEINRTHIGGQQRRDEGRHQGVDPRGPCPQRHKAVHIRRALAQGGQTQREKSPTGEEQHRRGQHCLYYP